MSLKNRLALPGGLAALTWTVDLSCNSRFFEKAECWHHRAFASSTKRVYASLSPSPTPFHCFDANVETISATMNTNLHFCHQLHTARTMLTISVWTVTIVGLPLFLLLDLLALDWQPPFDAWHIKESPPTASLAHSLHHTTINHFLKRKCLSWAADISSNRYIAGIMVAHSSFSGTTAQPEGA
ncbi:uncharacterized protein MYCFIDRAFT_171448 [Pseudocercospora fijiensis CIRAD86]|uniref:Uncharacterized protein n=1 Tax=Pseudocercospora fijiensis (strain CIRAD86) TaxID=383855 RepID=M3B892_PSEFD|nr:uncharacterized protein MYCFIDRAFT_171448 [Pseudocercospora fijiensis CIRAD86]EME85533.1 hypothetical protein MYCFIDRAFT_171448 [Pseudocercospora fijiensis CIRAD86]